MECNLVAPTPVRTASLAGCAQFKQQAQTVNMNGLKEIGVKSINIGSKYISIRGVNQNELFFTKESAMKFLKKFIMK